MNESHDSSTAAHGARFVYFGWVMATIVLTPGERRLLRDVRLSDEDHGGLAVEELSPDEFAAMARLCSLGLVEAVGAYGEAPDGEEDEREAGAAAYVYRITGAGVSVLADEPPADV
ncbi:MAG TPA: hypothetical protein VM580_02755 [Labilithrix sp.]|nr:hypothetical protein [Labilithrix sp.]